MDFWQSCLILGPSVHQFSKTLELNLISDISSHIKILSRGSSFQQQTGKFKNSSYNQRSPFPLSFFKMKILMLFLEFPSTSMSATRMKHINIFIVFFKHLLLKLWKWDFWELRIALTIFYGRENKNTNRVICYGDYCYLHVKAFDLADKMLLFLNESTEKKLLFLYDQQLYWQVIFKVCLEHEMEVPLPTKTSSLCKEKMNAWNKNKTSFL